MHKHISFLITAAVLLTAIPIVALYTVNAAHAQARPNMTSAGGAAKNMTGGPTKNMTGGSLIHKTTPAGLGMDKYRPCNTRETALHRC